MQIKDYLTSLLHSFERYYDVKTEDVTPPFDAEAKFFSHEEQYFLTKAAKLSESDSSETVYFCTKDNLDLQTLLELDSEAWNSGTKDICPVFGHRNSDVTLIIICEKISDEAFKAVKKLHHTKSFCFSFKGWSNYRLIVTETSSKRIACNRLGSHLKKLLNSIY